MSEFVRFFILKGDSADLIKIYVKMGDWRETDKNENGQN